MSKGQIATLVLLGTLASLALLGWWHVTTQPEAALELVSRVWPEKGGPEQAGLQASGVIQATEISISTEIGGRVAMLHVREGDEVAVGDLLVELDTALLEAQIAQAEAAIRMAEAGLKLLQAGVPSHEIAKAEANVRLKIAEREATLWAWQDALAIRDNPQELDMQIVVLEARLGALDHRVQQMVLTKEGTAAAKDMAERALQAFDSRFPNPLPPGDLSRSVETKRRELGFRVGEATNEWWSAWVGLNSAQAARDGAQRKLTQLRLQREQPLALQFKVDAAQAALDSAEDAVNVVQRQVDVLVAEPSEEELAVVRSQVAQAETAVEALHAQWVKMTLIAPRAGLVVGQMINEGEMAMPGASLLTIADLDQVTLTIYIPEDRIGRVKIGQRVILAVNAFPNRIFEGRVKRIANKAEFTPRHAQSKEERVNTIFAVQVEIANPEHVLKQGMSAEATILE